MVIIFLTVFGIAIVWGIFYFAYWLGKKKERKDS